jgi:hypothetical protein
MRLVWAGALHNVVARIIKNSLARATSKYNIVAWFILIIRQTRNTVCRSLRGTITVSNFQKCQSAHTSLNASRGTIKAAEDKSDFQGVLGSADFIVQMESRSTRSLSWCLELNCLIDVWALKGGSKKTITLTKRVSSWPFCDLNLIMHW